MKNILFISLIVLSLTVVYAEQIPTPTPVTDCKATLEAWGNPPNCYCPCDTCRPVCTDKQSMVNLYAESSNYDVNTSNSTVSGQNSKDQSGKTVGEKLKELEKDIKDKVNEFLGRPKGTDPRPVTGVRG